MFQATGKWMSRLATESRTVSGLCGLAAGTAWVSVSAVWWSAYEPLWPARAAWAVAVLFALLLISVPWVQRQLARIPRFWRVGIASCGFASWPTIWTLVAARRATFPVEWFTQDTTSFAVTAALAFCCVFPIVLLGCVPALNSHSSRNVPGGGAFWLGVSLAWAVLPTTLFSRVPVDRVLLIVSALMLLGAGISLFLGREETDLDSTPQMPPRPRWTSGAWVLSLAACGGLAVVLESALRISSQLVVDSLPFQLLGWSGFLAGIAISTLNYGDDATTSSRRTLFGLGVASVALSGLFPVWMSLAIWSSGTVSSFAGIVITKGAIPFLILAPLGWVFGRLCQGLTSVIAVCATGVAWMLVSRLAMPVAPAVATVGAVSLLGSLTLWSRISWSELVLYRGRTWATPHLAMLAALLVASWTGLSTLDISRSSRLVFNSESFAAASQGHDLETMERSDRSRLVKSFDGAGDHWTLWRQRSCQLLTRRNGIAVSAMTTDTGMSPQHLWPALSTIVPLTFHHQADHVLCIAPSGMAEIDTILTFPIQTLTCVSSSSTEQAVLKEQARLSGSDHRWTDGRVTWQTLAPSNFFHSLNEKQYDVIIAPEWAVAPATQQPQLTMEFHAAVAARLRDEGIFCQRLSIGDFGATPIVEMLRSLNAAFRQVSIVTTDGSELLLLATNSEYPIVDDQLLQRLETPHVRRLCAQLGGDWSMLTQLSYVTPDKVREIAGTQAPGNRVLSGQFALRLASDALRWGEKWKEKQALFVDRVTLVLVAMDLKEETEQMIARRIMDSQARVKILTETPDNQWAYRKELKEALKNRPRTKIQKVNNEIRQTFDEYDQHRKSYFLALGSAARQPKPSLESITAVEQFAEPYDPLLTDFAHFEAAHLLGRAATPDPAREYRNWLHCIGYAPVNDRSVRPVVAAMDLLRRHPEIVTDPELRWEQHGALLDAMRLRWVNRWQSGTNSKYDPADMQSATVAIAATLSTMDDLAATAGIDAERWKVQRQVWEDTLQSPLRERQRTTPPQDQMLESVRQELQRRNAELGETK